MSSSPTCGESNLRVNGETTKTLALNPSAKKIFTSVFYKAKSPHMPTKKSNLKHNLTHIHTIS